MADDNLKAVGFESFARGKNIKRLASVWRNSPEYGAWLETYLDPENKTVEYYEEDDAKIATFYRMLDEVETRNMPTEDELNVNSEEPAGPKQYEVLSTPHEHYNDNNDGIDHRVLYVKLGTPRWVPIGNRFGLCEYVFVESYRVTVNDDNGNFTHVTTRVTVTDDEQNQFEADPIYQAPAWMDVWEAMFAIGEYGGIENADAVQG